MTLEGDPGLIPATAMVGGLIVFVDCVDSLLVLRTVSDGQGTHDNGIESYTLVGDCYFLNLPQEYAAALDPSRRLRIAII